MSSRGSSDVVTDTAPWRVENIRDAPPTAEEWWRADCPADIDVYEEDEDGNIGDTPKVVISARMSTSGKKIFHNCGLETWLRARERWQRRTVDTLPERPSPAAHAQLVKGLTKASSLRTYELPRRMALSDLINVYTDIWEGDGL